MERQPLLLKSHDLTAAGVRELAASELDAVAGGEGGAAKLRYDGVKYCSVEINGVVYFGVDQDT